MTKVIAMFSFWSTAMTKVMTLLFHQSLASLRDVQSFDKKDKAQPTMAMEGLGVPTPSFPLP